LKNTGPGLSFFDAGDDPFGGLLGAKIEPVQETHDSVIAEGMAALP
jgi:hypothetical protein